MIKKKMALCLLIIIIMALFSSCAKKDKETKTAESIEDASKQEKTEILRRENEDITDNNSQNVNIGPVREQDTPPKTIDINPVSNVKTQVSTEKSSRKNQEFLPYNINLSLFPEDYKIGHLYNPKEASLENQGIAAIIINFLNALKNKNLLEDKLFSRVVFKTRLLLAQILDGKTQLQSYRIGSINSQDNSSRVNIRLWSITSTTEGEIYLSKWENRWFIEDIQIEIAPLDIPPEKEEMKFIPSAYDIQ